MSPENDGITHINIYSKGKTELGRFLSNFTRCPIETEDGHFDSIEGYWYWLSCKDDRLRTLSGFAAKYLGRELGGRDWCDDSDFKRKICEAITIKLNTQDSKSVINKYPELLKLQLVHYYTYGSKVVTPKEGKWILEHIKSVIT